MSFWLKVGDRRYRQKGKPGARKGPSPTYFRKRGNGQRGRRWKLRPLEKTSVPNA